MLEQLKKPPYSALIWDNLKSEGKITVEYFGNTRVEIYRNFIEGYAIVKHVAANGDRRVADKWFKNDSFYPWSKND